MKVSDALASAFVKEGVTTVFGLMGNGNMYWWHALDQYPDVSIYETRYEGTALTMAEGWARATGQTGICTVTQGPGLSQLATALVVAGARPCANGRLRRRDRARRPRVVQQFDQAEVRRRDRGRVRADLEGKRGRGGRADRVLPRPHRSRARSCSTRRWTSRPRTTTATSTSTSPPPRCCLAAERVQPDPDLLARGGRSSRRPAKKPVIVAGQGAAAAGAGEAVTRLADRIGALLATTLPMKGWLGESEYHVGVSGLYATRTAIELFADADVVIGVGASLNHYTTEHGYIFPNARYVQIDLKPSVVMGTGKRADHYVQGDAQLTMRATGAAARRPRGLEHRLPHRPDPRHARGVRSGPARVRAGSRHRRSASSGFDSGRQLPSEVGVVHGTGHCSGITAIFMRKPRKLTWTVNTFGCIGQAMPTAIGAAVALDGAPLAVVDGDASVLMHMSELETAARLGRQAAGHRIQRRGARSRVPEVRLEGYGRAGRDHSDARTSARSARAFGCRGQLAAHARRGQRAAWTSSWLATARCCWTSASRGAWSACRTAGSWFGEDV